MSKMLIRNIGTLVSGDVNNPLLDADSILTVDAKIKEVGTGLSTEGVDVIIDAQGTTLDVPLHFKDTAFVRSHFDAMEVRVTDAPREDEILVALVVTDSGRPLARVGGLKKGEAKCEDGLR